MKTSRIVNLLLYMLVFASLSMIVIGDDTNVCCCYPEGGGDLMPSSECNYEKVFDIPVDLDCADKCEESYVLPVETDLTCDDDGYDVPIELEVSLIKGSRGVILDWSSPCEPEYYEVIRKCKNSMFGCDTTSEVILNPSTLSTNYIDEYTKWDSNYTYIIKGHYALQGEKTADANASTGNLECWYKYDNQEFCVNENTYYRFRDFLMNDANPQFSEETFYSSVNAMFDRRLNRGFYCDEDNRIHQVKNCNQIGGTDDCDSAGGVDSLCSCVDRGGVAECAVRGECSHENADPYGLYFQQDESYCLGTYENPNYCFLDRSHTSVDACYSCDTRMDCYDYKTESACDKDNCGFGNCAWEYTVPDLGIGVCKNTASLNCIYCMNNGTADATNLDAYNAVFDQCTSEKADALSIGEDFKCYYNGLDVSYCISTICIDYRDQESCEINNPCGIDICKWYGLENKCFKDGDFNKGSVTEWIDCKHIIDENNIPPEYLHLDEDFRICQKDYFAPNLTVTPSDFRNSLPRLLDIKLMDKRSRATGEISVKDYSKGDYIVYLCLNNEPGTCLIESDYTNITQNSLDIYNLNITETIKNNKVIRYLFELKNGENQLKYYARDPSNNIGRPPQLLVFNASENASGPRVAYYDVEPGRLVDDHLYSNSRQPTFKVTFLSRPDIILRKDIYLSGHNQQIESDITWVNNTVNIKLKENIGDSDSYSLIMDARGSNGLTMDESYYFNFTIDTVPPVLESLSPEPDSVSYSSSLVTLEAGFDEKVILTKLSVDDKNYANQTTTRNNESFSASRVYLKDGTKDYYVEAEDYATNKVTHSSAFILNAVKELNIQMVKPSWGVSPEEVFDIELDSDNDAGCSYFFSLTPPGQIFDSFYVDFPNTGFTTHILSGFNKIPPGDENEYVLYAKCDDGHWDPTYTSFNLSVDTTPPEIEDAVANPEIIVDTDLNTSIDILASERVVCRYDTNLKPNYAELSYAYNEPIELSSFKNANTKEVHINSSETKGYTYYIACMDRAEWTTDIIPVGISVNLDAEYDVDLSRISSATNETGIDLTVLTNRKSMCMWGFSEETINYIETYNGDFKSVHQGRANSLSLGRNTLYFQCFDMAGRYSETKTKVITSDTTAPSMEYVNITSYHPDYPNPKIAPPLRALTAKLKAIDNETSSNIQYSYMLKSQFTDTILVNWTGFSSKTSLSIRKDDNRSLLYLDQGSYVLSAKPRNSVGLIGSIVTDTVTIDPTLASFCENGGFDNFSESDTDCGLTCPPCIDGKRCFVNEDCISNFCNITLNQEYGICAQSGCDDGFENGNETDEDCGGETCDKCDIGKKCSIDDDCESSNCRYGTCAETDTCKDHRLTLANLETDIDCGGYICLDRCDAGMNCIEHTDCMEGMKCKDDVCTQCAENDLDCDGILNDKDDDIDGDGIPNWLDPDDDNDGLCDTAGSPLNDPEICTDVDNDDDNDGILDYEDFDPDNDLDNDGIENNLDDDIDGDGILNDMDEDDDNDGIPDTLDDDTDNDGIPDRLEDDDNDGLSNEWELDHGLDPYNSDSDGNGILDGDEDWDDDGLNNIGEEEWGTDPDDPDTDGDGWEDGKEVERGTDPLDSEDKPKSYVWVYLLIMTILLGLVGGGYYGYMQYPEEVTSVIDNVKMFSRKYGVNLGDPSGKARVPGIRQPVSRRVPRVPAQTRLTPHQIYSRRKEQERKRQEINENIRKEKAVASRPDRITKLKEILEPGKKSSKEEWITLGDKKTKKLRVTKAIDKLENIHHKKDLKPASKEAHKHTLKRQQAKDIFHKLDKLKDKPSSDAMESLKSITKARKLSKDEIFRHLETLSKDKKVKNKHIDEVLGYVIDNKKASKKLVRHALSKLAEKEKGKHGDIHELLSKVKGKK